MQRFQVMNTPIEGLKILKTVPLSDDRGFFQRLFCDEELKEIGLNKKIVNINHSFTKKAGSIRGMHFQYQPSSEIKIVKCIRGAILDIAVDIRHNSPTFLQPYSIELTESNNTMLYIPEGFAHGFQTLDDNSEIIYFVTNYYSKELEMSLNPFDERLGIEWSLKCTDISDKDVNAKMIDGSFIGVQ
jgi:dTDP-4-dehydrorhamnose 3,5-epimerase